MNNLNDCIAWLNVHGKEVGKASSEGNILAYNIIGYYQMVHRRKESGAIAFLCSSIDEYIKKTDNNSYENVESKDGVQ